MTTVRRSTQSVAVSLFEPPPPPRALDDVRDSAAQEVAVRAIRKSKLHEGVRIGVNETMTVRHPAEFLCRIADNISYSLTLQPHLFALVSPPSPQHPAVLTLIVFGSSADHVQRAMLLASAKFTGRVLSSSTTPDPLLSPSPKSNNYNPLSSPLSQSSSIRAGAVLEAGLGLEKEISANLFIATLHTPPTSPAPQTYDIPALHDILHKATLNLLSPLLPPPQSLSAKMLLSLARADLQRLSPDEAFRELTAASADPDTSPARAVTLIIDIRSESQRVQYGRVPGAIHIERNELVWRMDPREPVGSGVGVGGGDGGRLSIADRYDIRAIVVSQRGDASSFAAVELVRIGLLNATDVVGGFEAWKERGLPVEVD